MSPEDTAPPLGSARFAHHIVQVDVGAPPDELLDDLQAALLRRQHQRRLTVLYAGDKMGQITYNISLTAVKLNY